MAASSLGITLVVFLAMLATALAFSGDATYFNVGLGACGHHNNNNQLVAALNKPQYGGGGDCGKRAHIKGPKGEVTVTIVDECPGCAYGSLDLSPAAFSHIAELRQGRVHIEWQWA